MKLELTTLLDGKNLTIQNNRKYKSVFNLRRGQFDAINSINDNFLENLLFVAPTAYGKTVVALYYIIKCYNAGLKCIYCAPLKALTAEIVKKLNKLGLEVLIDTGEERKKPDLDYKKCDVLVCTYERLDAVIRNPKYHNVLEGFGLIVIDEIHTVHSKTRGVNLESLIVKLKYHTSMSIMGMSATVDNYEEMAEFINANCIYVPIEARPVKQNIFIKYYDCDYYKQSLETRNIMLRELINNLIRLDKQALIFCSSRSRCEMLARSFSDIKSKDVIEIAKKSNYAWHHAGLQQFEREKIESMFEHNELRFIFCTPTLAMGVNLPAYCVVIYDTTRWNGLISNQELIDSLEIEQMFGRAGRPQYNEKECEVHIYSREQDRPYEITENIVISKLLENLKCVINEWVCSGVSLKDEIKHLLSETLMDKQFEHIEIMKFAKEAVNFLVNNGFINYIDDEFSSSFFGKMTALFYIKPETALHFKNIERGYYDKEYSDLELVASLINTQEFLDLIRVENRDKSLIDLTLREFENQGISIGLYDERILKAIPMILTNYFNDKYHVQIKMYRTDIVAIGHIMERIFTSAEVIIYNKELKKRISDLKIMVKNRTLDRNVAILKNTSGIGDVRLNRLLNANIKTPEKFLKTSDQILMRTMKVNKETLDKIKTDLIIQMKK